MSEVVVETAGTDQGTKQMVGPTCESPPAAEAPAREEVDPRARLRELAGELVRTQNRRLIFEYLRLRRAVR
jgi:hypothetical protein